MTVSEPSRCDKYAWCARPYRHNDACSISPDASGEGTACPTCGGTLTYDIKAIGPGPICNNRWHFDNWRAEPSRGAPDADYLQKIDELTSLLDTIRTGTGGAINFLLRDAYKAGRERGHVVLLEALRRAIELIEPLIETDNEMAPEWDAEAKVFVTGARAAIKQAERT